MPKRIGELTAAAGLAVGDVLVVVDIDDTTEAATGTTKQLTLQNLSEFLAGDLTFVLGGTSVKGGFRQATTLTLIADAVFDVDVVELAADGNYSFTIFVLATDVSGNTYKAKFTLDFDRVGGALVGDELAAPIELVSPTAGLVVTFDDDGDGDLETSVMNSSGELYMNAVVYSSWSFQPYPAAPDV